MNNLGTYPEPNQGLTTEKPTFGLFHLPASGSTWLESMLKSSGFFDFSLYIYQTPRGDHEEAKRRIREVCFEKNRTLHRGRAQAIGFKTFPTLLGTTQQVVEFMRAHRMPIVHIERMNAVKAAISNIRSILLSKQSGIRFVEKGSGKSGLPPVPINPEEFLKYLRGRKQKTIEMEDFLFAANRAGIPILRVTYESLLCAPVARTQEVARFLGYEEVNEDSLQLDRFEKHTSDRLADAVPNIAELRAAVAGTSYEQMFDEMVE